MFSLKGKTALVTGGGSIDIGDIASVSFAAAGSAGVYTVKATATPTSGSPLDITSEVTAWTLKLYYLNTYTGMTSATNTMDLSALGEGTYIMKINAVYGGKTYSGEVEIVKGPVGLGTPLTLEAAVAGAVVTFDNKATGPVTYTVNGGTGGTIASGESKAITLSAAGDKVQFYGDNVRYAQSDPDYSNIACSADCYVYGNIMSLVKSAGFASENELTSSYNFTSLFYNNTKIKNKTGYELLLPATKMQFSCYKNMFHGCTGLTTAPALPATKMEMDCYQYMFYGCTRLAAAPALPATTLADFCYCSMFRDCTSLVSAPALPAPTLINCCYQDMFRGCTNLTTAPELPATTLKSYCYRGMFYNCTSLTTAPELTVTMLANSCYLEMFQGCTSLNSVTCLATDISATDCTKDWLKNVAPSGTFTKAAGMTGWTTGADGIPSGWTVQDAP